LHDLTDLTVSEAFVVIMQYSLRHKLSTPALQDLIKLLRLFLPEYNLMADSVDSLRAFFAELEHVGLLLFFLSFFLFFFFFFLLLSFLPPSLPLFFPRNLFFITTADGAQAL